MSKSVYTEAHRTLVEALVSARQRSGLLQAELGQRVGKDQSYVSNIERGQRRVDVVEFTLLARAMGVEPVGLFREYVESLSKFEDR